MYHGKITKAHKKRKYAIGGEAAMTTLGSDNKKKIKGKGAVVKTKLLSTDYANVVIGDKAVKCEIVSLVENPSNKDFTRRNVITKGAVLKVRTPEGKEVDAKITSRPGQDGILNAVSLL